ncbi:hypothetical protein GCM10027605_62500 [Micromonospora zhanjiangensis]
MTESVSRYPCPSCRAGADLTSGCPGCGRPADPLAAEVVRLNGELDRLAGQVNQARQTYLGLYERWRATRYQRDAVAAQVRAVARPAPPVPAASVPRLPAPAAPALPVSPVPAPAAGFAPLAPAPAGVSAPGGRPAGDPPAGDPPGRPETSVRTVQNLLFVLGGLLLGTAAVVFTAVAWATVEVVGRATILSAITALMLAVPPVLVRRGLRATAETFAAVALLLVVLDGYAAWTVDLLGVAGWPTSRYAGTVVVGAAVLAVGFGRLTGLRAPWYAGLLLAQVGPPTLAYETGPDVGGWALVATGVAALDLAVLRRVPTARTADLARRVVGWLAYGIALLVATGCGLVALAVLPPAGRPVLAGGPLLAVVLLLALGAAVAGHRIFVAAAGAAAPVVLALAVLRPVLAYRPQLWLLAAAVTVAALTTATTLADRWPPAAGLAAARFGVRIGALVNAGWLGLLTVPLVLLVAATTMARSVPVWRADVTRPVDVSDWQLPVAVVLAAVAWGLLLPRAARGQTAVAGGVLGVLALPAAVALPWWLIPALDLAVAVGLLLAAVRQPPTAVPGGPVRAVAWAVVGALLTGHAVLVGLARPVSAAVVLAVVLVAGAGVAVRSRAATVPVARSIGGASLTVGLLAWPPLVAVGSLAAGVPAHWRSRAVLAAVVLLAAGQVAVRRRWPATRRYVEVALAVAAVSAGWWPVLSRTGEPLGLYAALALLALAAAVLPADAVSHRGTPLPDRPGRPGVVPIGAGWLLLTGVVVAVLPAVAAVLVAPYAWLGAVWSGAPRGVGLTPGGWPLPGTAGIALLVLAAALVMVLRTGRSGRAAVGPFVGAVGAVAGLVLLAEAGARWPTVPAVALTGGLGVLLAAALSRPSDAPPGAATPGPAGAAADALVGTVAGGGGVAVGGHPPERSGARVGRRVGLPLGLVLAGAGFAGALPTRASTLTALALVLAAAAAVGVSGRAPGDRLAGWLTAVLAGGTFAVAATRAAELPPHRSGFAVLVVAVAALAVGWALRLRRPAEATVLDAAGQAAAVVALLLTLGDPRYAATVCTLWGAAVGIRALRPGRRFAAGTCWRPSPESPNCSEPGCCSPPNGWRWWRRTRCRRRAWRWPPGRSRCAPGRRSAAGPRTGRGWRPRCCPAWSPCWWSATSRYAGCCWAPGRWWWCWSARIDAGRHRCCWAGSRSPCWRCASWSPFGTCCPGGCSWRWAGSS